MSHAPVLITVYNRIEHFKKCIASLANNVDADKTPLFVAIDAPYRDQDVEVNNEIFEFSKIITGFKTVEIIKREKNVGSVTNAKMARDDVFSKYESLIRSEDDNIFSPYFIKFINDGLNRYSDDHKIFAICGYSEPIYFEDLLENYDSYLRRGFSSFGSGLWRDKLGFVDTEAAGFYRELLNPLEALRFIRSVGSNIYGGLLVSKRKKEIYPDMTYVYHIYKHKLHSVHPKKTLVRNIGQDGSGLHSGVDMVLQNQEIFKGLLDACICTDSEMPEIRRRLNAYHMVGASSMFKYFLYYYYNYARQVLPNAFVTLSKK